ncbi:MAG: hypothetical protein IJY25_05110 [Bacilli bacterium]|nr:hypothetical protein [Bacilli bacterium]
MKEAAGEANMTVITIVLIAIVLAVGTIIVNRMMNSSERSSCCASVGGEVNGRNCQLPNGTVLQENDANNAYGACLADNEQQ